MKIAIDFDGTVVRQDRKYDDVESPLTFMDGAPRAIAALRAAGHMLLLWSGRASRALLFDPALDPFVRAGVVPLDTERWRRSQGLNVARYRQMVDFVNAHCLGWFDAIDDGSAGKPSVDLFIDDRALRLGNGLGGHGWTAIAELYGAIERVQR